MVLEGPEVENLVVATEVGRRQAPGGSSAGQHAVGAHTSVVAAHGRLMEVERGLSLHPESLMAELPGCCSQLLDIGQM